MQDSLSASDEAIPFLHGTFDVRVTRDVKYGEGKVGFSADGASRGYRDLRLDVYEPVTASDRPRPALIMAFGGAFHRGSKSEEVFEGENPCTGVAEYCRQFARRGYVCFSIDYRLMQEAPDPGITPTLPENQALNLDRTNYVREILGLPPCTRQMMADTIEAGTDDVSRAVSFVRARSRAYNVDVSRIAIGGFSAGATLALNAGFAERAPVAAVVALSGRLGSATMNVHVTGAAGEPAMLLFHGENDLPAVLSHLDEMDQHFSKVGIDHEIVCVRGENHFYLRSAGVQRRDGSSTDVETLMAEFLYRRLGLDKLITSTAV